MKRAELDSLWAEFRDVILVRDSRRCFTCGGIGGDPSHMLSKGAFPALRFHPLNVHVQCRWCHSAHHSGSDTYKQAFVEEYGEDGYEALLIVGRGDTPTADRIREVIESVKRGCGMDRKVV